MGFNWPKAIKEDFIDSPVYREATRPRTVAEREAMSDEELRQHLAEVIRLEISSYDPPWYGLLWYMGDRWAGSAGSPPTGTPVIVRTCSWT